MYRDALVRVLGAVAYGELKAYEGAKQGAADVDDEVERKRLRKVAAEELRHHKGFVARLQAWGADPDQAMAPFRTALDTYHGLKEGDEIEIAVAGYLGEGIADDLLGWLRQVVDPETATFIDSVIEDEIEHLGAATEQLNALLDASPDGRARAAAGARRVFWRMATSGRRGGLPLIAFVRLGRTPELIDAVFGGMARRLAAIDVDPLGLPSPVRRVVRPLLVDRAAA